MKFNLKRIIPLLSCFAIVLACLVVPVKVSADAVDKTVVNLLPASGYRYEASNGSTALLTKPILYFSNVTSASWRWQAGQNDVGFTGFVITIQVSNGKAPAHLYMLPYDNGPTIELTKIGSSGNYIQYQYNNAVSTARLTLTAEWSSAYYGYFNIVSFYGILGDLISIPKAARQVVRYTYTSGGFSRGELSSSGAEDLPLYLQSDYSSPSADFYDVYNFGIRNSYIPFRYLEEMTFFFATTSPEADVSVYVAEDKNLWSSSVIYKTLPVDVSLSFTADTEYVSGRYYNLYYYSATVDLSEVDLSGKMINLTFNAVPVGDNDTVASLFYIAARPPVEEIPWYQNFYQWIKDLWTSNNDALTDAIGSGNDTLVNGTPEQQQQVAAGKDKMEAGASDLGQLNEDMKVDQPDIDTSKFTADELIGASGMRLLGTPFLKLWESDLLSTVIVLVVSVSLISYVFFGKKG